MKIVHEARGDTLFIELSTEPGGKIVQVTDRVAVRIGEDGEVKEIEIVGISKLTDMPPIFETEAGQLVAVGEVNMVTIDEMAEMHQVNRKTIERGIDRGEIRAVKTGEGVRALWEIPRTEAEAYEPRGRGRPKSG